MQRLHASNVFFSVPYYVARNPNHGDAIKSVSRDSGNPNMCWTVPNSHIIIVDKLDQFLIRPVREVSESPLRCSICSRGPGEIPWLRWVYNKQSKLRRPVGGRCMDCNKMVQSALERKVFGPDVCTANTVWKHKGLRSRAASYRDEWCRMSPAERLRAHMGAVGQQAVQLVETDEAVLTTTPYDLLPLEEPLQDKVRIDKPSFFQRDTHTHRHTQLMELTLVYQLLVSARETLARSCRSLTFAGCNVRDCDLPGEELHPQACELVVPTAPRHDWRVRWERTDSIFLQLIQMVMLS